MQPMKIPLHADTGIEVLACVDLSSGVVLDSSARDERTRETIDLAVMAACQLSVGPRPDAAGASDEDAREALIVSERGIHALARSERHPDRVVVAVAHPGSNVALVLATVRSIANALSD